MGTGPGPCTDLQSQSTVTSVLTEKLLSTSAFSTMYFIDVIKEEKEYFYNGTKIDSFSRYLRNEL
jgi:hypothetical protein